MKNKIALLLLMLVALSVVLVACNQPDATVIITRWDNEMHVFAISLADYAPESSSNLFSTYSHENNTYYKDMIVSTTTVREPSTTDEIVPNNVTGSYTLKITLSDDKQWCTVDTHQVIYAQYYTERLQCLEELTTNGYVVTSAVDGDEVASTFVFDEEECTVLRSETTTSVTFKNDPSQRPTKSSTTSKGFYIGNKFQGTSAYTISTTYDFDKNVATVVRDGGEPVENKIKVAKARNFIDSNQILMYVRSLEKGETSFQDNPTVDVYSPISNRTEVANFGYVNQVKVVLNNNGTNLYAHNSSVAVSIGSNALMMTQCLPGTLAEKGLDVHNDLAKSSKYTINRFRSGFLSYEVTSYNQQIADEIVVKTTSAQ